MCYSVFLTMAVPSALASVLPAQLSPRHLPDAVCTNESGKVAASRSIGHARIPWPHLQKEQSVSPGTVLAN
jgi:hypothetical protein